MPVDADQAIKAGVVRNDQRDQIQQSINADLQVMGSGMTASQLMSFDIIASSIAQGWNRPCYFAMTVPNSYYLGLDPYLRLTGLAYQVTPLVGSGNSEVSTDIMYDNVVNKFKWGGLDTAKPGSLYLDETICRMVTTMRSALIDLAKGLLREGDQAKNGTKVIPEGMTQEAYVADRYKKARTILDLMLEKLPVTACPFTIQMGQEVANVYYFLSKSSGDNTCLEKSNKLLEDEILRYGNYVRFYQSLSPSQYERLTRVDKFIDQQHLLDLLADYAQQCGEAKYEAIAKKLSGAGVNMERQMAYQRAYEQSMQQSAAQQAAAQAQEEADAPGLEEVLAE
jgi:ribosomal protein L12E/L44/L45/RPP1/RPP2